MNEKLKTIIEHLEEFRGRLIRCIICVGILFFPANYIALPSINWIRKTLCPGLEQLIYTKPLEIIMTQLNVAFYIALLASIPYVAYQIWLFVSPALFKKERYYVMRFASAITLLFLGGASFALFLVFPMLIKFSMSLGGGEILPMITVQSFINTAALLMLAFGIMFQLPVLIFVLVMTGMLDTVRISKLRPYIVVIIFIVATILTPPDIISQLAMAIPSWVLFELSLLAARFMERRRRAAQKKEINKGPYENLN